MSRILGQTIHRLSAVRRTLSLQLAQSAYSNPRTLNTMSSEKPLVLYTARTPNGFKATILLEELKEVYGSFDYEFVLPINISRPPLTSNP
jgi:hypothetical protein